MLKDTRTWHDGQLSQSFNAGYIFLSYLVSVAGCATGLELLHRRTARFGRYNWFLLVTSAVATGGIGIWCMHFIGNRAIILLYNGTKTTQILYSSGYTALSFFIPIIVLQFAFYLTGTSERPKIVYILLAGALTGGAACGMHYVGKLGIANYTCSYAAPNIVGAVVIAVSASTAALAAFFRLRASWSNSWWKRGLSAAVLAAAVSGMHWTAVVGTHYHPRSTGVDITSRLTATQTVIVCASLASVACLFLIALAILGNRQYKRSAHRVRQLVLACAYFDPSGAIMVSAEGLLPTHKITDHYVGRTFADEEFGKTHEAFIWAFRATRNWQTLLMLIPGMKYHLVNDQSMRQYCPGGSTDGRNEDGESDVDFALVFKELFCIAAQELATQINQPLDKIGVLYDDVMITGTHIKRSKLQRRVRPAAESSDPENGQILPVIGKGHFLFIVRNLESQEALNFAASGYRFAAIPQITPTLARRMQVSDTEIPEILERMKDYPSSYEMMKPGVHLVCFSLTPCLRKGFDVLVPKETPNVLPHVTLPFEQVSQRQLDILVRMDGFTITSCIQWLQTNGEYSDPEQVEFCQQMHQATSRLAAYVADPAFGQAKFSSRAFSIPCKTVCHANGPTNCTAFSFRVINGLQSRPTSPQLHLSPLRLFHAHQQVCPGVPDHEHFRQAVLEEFPHCAQHDQFQGWGWGSGLTSPSFIGTSSTRNLRNSYFSSHSRQDEAETSPQGDSPFARQSLPRFGGIVVSNQITVDVSDGPGQSTSVGYGNEISASEMNGFNGTSVEGGYIHRDEEIFVDELFALFRDREETRLESCRRQASF